MDVSIILPCYNEAQVLGKTVSAVRRILDKTTYSYEIIIAEDSSSDGTADIAKEFSGKFDNIIWQHRDKRRSRGSAVSDAIKKAKGRIVGYIDVDLETPAHYIYPLILEIEGGADIATCIRVFKIDKRQLLFRLPKVASHYCYLWLVRKILRVNLKDTEAGFKFFNRARILPILSQIKDEHWFWDTEVMVRSYYNGYKIKEIPTLFLPSYTRISKVNLFKDSCDYLSNLFKFSKELRQLYGASAISEKNKA